MKISKNELEKIIELLQNCVDEIEGKNVVKFLLYVTLIKCIYLLVLVLLAIFV